MAKPLKSAYTARIIHRYLGFFLAGIMAVYAISGIVLVYRKGDTFKQDVVLSKTIDPGMEDAEVGKKLRLKEFRVDRVEGEVIYFQGGHYDRASGEAEYTKKELPYILDQMASLHKSTTNDPLYFLNVFFGVSLLLFVITAFWMYLPSGPILRKGLLFAAAGFVLTLVLLFI